MGFLLLVLTQSCFLRGPSTLPSTLIKLLIWLNCRHYKLPFPFLTERMLAAELRCHCIQTVTGLMLPKHLANVEIIPKGPHCATVEIIATLKNSQQICLDPQAKWVKMLINKILHRKEVSSNCLYLISLRVSQERQDVCV
uniref:C-X-C motif chemokine n=1 Tax=Falco tinnunculus TaxID=100819 RepID=A0A8C4UXI0_FALTI